MKALNYPVLVNDLKSHHHLFFDKYSNYVSKSIGERQLERGVLLARLTLIAKAMKDAGVIRGYSEVNILNHDSSIMLHPKLVSEPFYLLNDCVEVVASCGGISSEDALSGQLVLVQSEANSAKTTFMKRYKNVLSDEFEWTVFAHEILEAIHKTLYNKNEVQMEYLKAELFND